MTLHWDLVYRHIISPVLSGQGYDVVRIKDKFDPSKDINAALKEHLKNVDLVVADLSDNNPNVFFELGFRHARHRPFVCISDNPDVAAFWGNTFQIINYTSDDAQAKLSDAIVAAESGRQPLQGNLGRLSECLSSPDWPAGNVLKQRLATWRLSSMTDQLDLMKNGTWTIEARRPTVHVARAFEEIVENLAHGDEYWTVTNEFFWREALEGAASFLRKNVAAVKGGAHVKRVFVLPRGQQETLSLLREHQAAIQEAHKATSGRMLVRVKFTDDFDRDTKTYGHFAVLRATVPETGDIDRMLVEPRHAPKAEGGHICALDVSFTRRGERRTIVNVERKETMFDQLFESAAPLEAGTNVKELIAKREIRRSRKAR